MNRRILEFEKRKLKTKDDNDNDQTQSEKNNILEYQESEILEIKKKQRPNTDLSDHNSFVKSSPAQLMRLWGQKKKSQFFREAQTSEGADGYFTQFQS